MLTGIVTVIVTMIILIAPVYIGLHYSKKSIDKRREKENNSKKE